MMITLITVLCLIAFFLYNNSGIFLNEDINYKGFVDLPPLDGGEDYRHIGENEKAILFIHGFPGSPKMYYLIREMAKESGYDVYCPRLPGFSSTIEYFVKTNFSMWFLFIMDYYKNIRINYKEFYVVGTSMGGALTLKITEELSNHPDLKPTAIASVAAPVFINNIFMGVIKNPLLYLIRTISHFKSYIEPKRPAKDKSLDQDGDTEWVGYRGLFPKQIFSLLIGLKSVKKNLHKVSVPCYLCQAKEDKTVSFKNLYYINDKISSDDKLIRVMSLKEWKHSNHSMFIYKSIVENLWSDIDGFFEKLKK